MRRLLIVLAFVLLLPSVANAKGRPLFVAASTSSSRTAAAAWVVLEGEVPRDVFVATGRPGALGAPVEVTDGTGRVGRVWVVAEPGGGARVLWTARYLDFARPVTSRDEYLRARRISADGTLEPIDDVSPPNSSPAVATNERGQVLVTWKAYGNFGDPLTYGAAQAEPVAAFTRVDGDLGPSPLPGLAADGSAVIASTLYFRERPAGGTFGPLVELPPHGSAQPHQPSLASDGTMTLLSEDGFLSIRMPNGTFTEPTDLGSGPVSAHAILGGKASVFEQQQGTVSVVDFTTDGQPPVVHVLPGVNAATVSVREDGAAIAGVPYLRLFGRSQFGAFAGPTSLSGSSSYSIPAVSLSSAGVISAWAEGQDVFASGQKLAHYEPASKATARLRVLPGRVYVRRSTARVPVHCERLPCEGTINGKSFHLPRDAGAYVQVPTTSRGKSVRITVKLNGRSAETTRRRFRKIAPSLGPCGTPPWATTLARSGNDRLIRVGRNAGQVAFVCAGRRRQQVAISDLLLSSAQDLGDGAVSARYAAVIDTRADRSEGSVDLVRLDRKTGEVASFELFPFFGEDAYSASDVVVDDHGAMALMDSVEGRSRVRVIDRGGDRIVDVGPGVDRHSLARSGSTITWKRAGMKQSARLIG